MSKRRTLEEFIAESKLIHGDKYDYSLVDYKRRDIKVKIICPIHGVFEQIAYAHLSSFGCKKCGRIASSIKQRKSVDTFIEEAKQVHGDKYDYSLVDYKNKETPVKIICKKHNYVFTQIPNDHLRGHGCDKCSGKHHRSLEEFLCEARQVHGDKYDYSLAEEFKNQDTPIKIICPIHGLFEQSFQLHVTQRYGCPMCNSSHGEEKIRSCLNGNGLKFQANKKFNDLVDKTNLSYDLFVEDYNLLIEYNGEQHYRFVKHFHKTLHKFHKQKHHDWLKRRYAIKNNINLLVIPYWEFDNIEKIIDETIDKISRNCYNSVKGVK